MVAFAAAKDTGAAAADPAADPAAGSDDAGKAAAAAGAAAGALDPAAAAAGAGDPAAAAGDPPPPADEAAAPVPHKRIRVLCSRDRTAGEIVDRVLATLDRDHVAPADGFVVSAEKGSNGLPDHIVVSFDPDHGAVDREIVRAAIFDQVEAALRA